jgi:hypothetical protein
VNQPWNWRLIAAGCLFFTLLTWWVSGNPFFWDTVQLASKHAHFFYDNNFSVLTLPNEIDSGHPPAWGMYIALSWKFFGQTLPVSHFMVLPFQLGIVIQSYLLFRKLLPEKNVGWAMLLLLADSTLLAQSTLVSPDVALVFFYLLGMNAMMSGRKGLLTAAALGLGIISMRGMMCAVALYFSDLIWNVKKSDGSILKQAAQKLLPYIPAALAALAWLIWHYSETGWIGYHDNSPWAGSFERVGLVGMIRNVALMGWSFLDFGRVWIWLTALLIVVLAWNKIISLRSDKWKLAALAIIPVLCFAPSMITHKHLVGHRYLLIPILFFAVAVITHLAQIQSFRLRNSLIIILAAGLLTGNLWRYPQGVATGWDATLGHLPYYSLRNEMLNYMNENKIPVSETGSSFPNLASFKEIDLSSDTTRFREKDLDRDNYIFYSNVYNGFTDEEFHSLQTNWHIEKELNCYPVKIILYKKGQLVKPLPFIYFQF